MMISVIIPAYNSASTIRATLDSVLCQTSPADEILVMDDGSEDETAAILKLYEPRIKMFRQRNAGLSAARNALIARARGDLIAPLDSDDLWHPRYLETQRKLFDLHPEAAAFFIAHSDFIGLGPYDWGSIGPCQEPVVEVLEPIRFLSRLRMAPDFVMSFCCIPMRILGAIGAEPFKLRIAEDAYFCRLLPFLGPVVMVSAPLLGAYRIREGSLASNRLRLVAGEVSALELVRARYTRAPDRRLRGEFRRGFAAKRRSYAKILLGAGEVPEARRQVRRSLGESINPVSFAKSSALLFLSYLPGSLQPGWPPAQRKWAGDGGHSQGEAPRAVSGAAGRARGPHGPSALH